MKTASRRSNFRGRRGWIGSELPDLGKFKRTAHEFAIYIASNAGSLINCGERYRSGERMSSCLAKTTANAVISKRVAEWEQMQWTKRGAYLLLQTRTRTLDGTLRSMFERWYPGLGNNNGTRRLKPPRREHPTHPDALTISFACVPSAAVRESLAASSSDVTVAALRLRMGARFTYDYELSIPGTMRSALRTG